MPAAIFRRIPLTVSWPQADRRATELGSTEVTAASGMPAQPYQARPAVSRWHDLNSVISEAAGWRTGQHVQLASAPTYRPPSTVRTWRSTRSGGAGRFVLWSGVRSRSRPWFSASSTAASERGRTENRAPDQGLPRARWAAEARGRRQVWYQLRW
jgi:hypothetical protein